MIKYIIAFTEKSMKNFAKCFIESLRPCCTFVDTALVILQDRY